MEILSRKYRLLSIHLEIIFAYLLQKYRESGVNRLQEFRRK